MANNMQILYEGAFARMERANKRLWIVVIILIAALILTNAAWIYYESQFQVTSIEAEQDGGGVNIVGGGDITYGPEGEDQNKDAQNRRQLRVS